MNSPPAIEITGLTKAFGQTIALDRVDLTVDEGCVFGFLGPNGAGKTTTLRILTGLARPTSGTARILGNDIAAMTNDTRGSIGFLPDVPGFYSWMTAEQFLLSMGRLFGLERPLLRERSAALLDMAGLLGVKTKIGGYSRGMKQRLGLAQALINAPRLLLLDEPTSALDPIGRKDVLEMIASLKGRTTVFFSSHILADVERVCDTVAILNRGKVVAQASVTELKRKAGARSITVEAAGDVGRLHTLLAEEPWVRRIERTGDVLQLTVSDLSIAQRSVPAAIVSAGIELRRFETGEVSLEEVFVDLVSENGE